MKNKYARLGLTAMLVLMLAMTLVGTTLAVSGAVSTTDNPGYTVPSGYQNQDCLNGQGVNCNIYGDKRDVWFSGLPVTASLGAGNYFFAVLEPGGQGGNDNPNDGTSKNLSSPNDTYVNREFSVDITGAISYSGNAPTEAPHEFDSANNKLQLFSYDDTTNPGGVYILAVCSLNGTLDPAKFGEPGVDPSDCKYDAFKVGEQGVEDLTVSKDANASLDRTYHWTISKSVDKTLVKTPSSDVTFNYTVQVSHDGGTDSSIVVNGTIVITNPNLFDVTVNVADNVNDPNATCTIDGSPSPITVSIPGNDSLSLPYVCTYTKTPQSLDETNTVTITWSGFGNGEASFSIPFTFNINEVEKCVAVNDSYTGNLGTVCVSDANPTTFNYSRPVTGVPGTCTAFDNTATFTTNDTGATGSASQTVKVCVGSDLTVSKTATPSFKRTYNWDISKTVDKTLVKQAGGTVTFNYVVKVAKSAGTDSNWAVTGNIHIANPNDWEAITADVTDLLPGGNCSVTGEDQVKIPASGAVDLPYTCTFSGNPGSGTNSATAVWNADTAHTPNGSKTGTANFTFGAPTTAVHDCVTVTDPNSPNPPLPNTTCASKTYNYSKTVSVPQFGCVTYSNTATFVATDDSNYTGNASQSVQVCGPAKTGALTMGFWQNKNGQGIITGQAKTGVCPSGTWLRQYSPFQDLSSTATCAQVGNYVTNVIKAANASGSSMNAMLKAQMLATSLDVYFSSPALGGNKINAPAPIGGVTIDLTMICKMIDSSGGSATCDGNYQNVSGAFGGTTQLTVSQMLAYAASQSNAGGSSWYGQVKATQELAKNAFDAINNQVAFAP